MLPFTLYNPVKLHFGKDVLKELPETLALYGKKVLFIYGKGSIKASGLYDRIISQLNSIQAEVVEYSGIKSNPIYEDADKAAELGRKHHVDLILAVGGGSVIDTAKMVSITIPVNHSVWDFYEKGIQPKSARPVITVLTLAATGTEMNPYAVLQNNQTGEKRGYGSELTYPKHSFLDPEHTFSVPKNYTSYGISDLIAHSLEQYFGEGDSSLTDKFTYSVIQEAMAFGPQLLTDLKNFELREKIMWLATVALNGWLKAGRKSGDWGVHGIEHTLSVLYDIPHGAGLSIVYPAWLKHMKSRIPERISELMNGLFGTKNIDLGIQKLEAFFGSIESPVYLEQANISKDEESRILEHLNNHKVSGMYHQLTDEDHLHILNYMFKT